MNRIILLVLALVAVFTTAAVAQSIVGTKHDLSTGGGIADKSTNESQVCIFCHTPHQKGISADPLWNHTLSTNATYGTYTSGTLDATDVTEIGGGTGISNLCMSCHDGTVAVNSLGNTSTVGTPTMGNAVELDATGKIRTTREAYLGTSLSDDHPINFTYDNALYTADGGLKDPATLTDVKLFAGKMQCSSCHNAHSNANAPFLRASNSASGLCLKCHDK